MRRVSTRVLRGGAVLALLALLIMPVTAHAADEPAPPDPPQGRMGPPIGLTSEEPEPSFLDDFWSWLLTRLDLPIG